MKTPPSFLQSTVLGLFCGFVAWVTTSSHLPPKPTDSAKVDAPSMLNSEALPSEHGPETTGKDALKTPLSPASSEDLSEVESLA